MEACRRMDFVKCLLRRLRVSTERALVAVTIAAIAAAGAAAQPAATDDTAKGLATLEAFLGGVRSLTADFTQELYSADERLLETETGTFALERPNRFRWSYVEPSELTVVGDMLSYDPYGIMYRKDDPGLAQVVERTFTRLAETGAIVRLYNKWLLGPLPDGGRLNRPMTPQLEEALHSLGWPE